MGLCETDKIDLATTAFPGDDCKLVLYIMDSGLIEEPVERYRLLLSKLTTYFDYAEQRCSSRPDWQLEDVVVCVLYEQQPTPAMRQIQAIDPGGMRGRMRVRFEAQAEFFARVEAMQPQPELELP